MFLTLVILRLSLLALPSSGALRSLLSFSGCSQASSRFQRTAGLEAIFPLWFRHVSAEQAERRALEQVLPAACTEPPSGSSSCAEVAGGAAPQPLRRSRAEINPMIAARSRSRIARSRFELGRRGWGGCSQLPGQSCRLPGRLARVSAQPPGHCCACGAAARPVPSADRWMASPRARR